MRQRKRLAAFSVLALAASVLAVFATAPAANAATVTNQVACTNTFAAATLFNLPVDMTTTATPSSVEEGGSFDVQFQASIPLSEAFIGGVVAVAPITSLVVNSIKIEIPVPANVTTNVPNLNLTWNPGPATIATQSDGPDGIPGNEDDVFTPVPGGVTFTSPPVTRTFTATSAAPSTVDFFLNNRAASAGSGNAHTIINAPIEMNLTILGAVPVGFDCIDGAYSQNAGPDGNLGTSDDFFEAPAQPTEDPWLSVPVTPPPATVVIDDISGQAVNDAARAGNVIDFSGPNWEASSDITVEMCDLALTTCSAADLTGVTASIDVDGNLDGQATVAAGATTGARALQVTTDADQSDDIQILVLGTPTISVVPNEAGVGAPVDVHGTNWNPNSLTTVVTPTNGVGTPIALPTGVTVNNVGVFDTELTVIAGTALIAGADLDPAYPQPPGPTNPGSLFAFTGFTVSENDCTVLDPSGCTIEQTVLFTTDAGTLSMSQETGIINLGELDLDGLAHHIPGDINEITTIDATGSLNGWSLTATMTDLVTDGGGANRTIAAGNMHWTPDCDPIDANLDGIVDGIGSDVVTGDEANLDPTIGRTLCIAAAGGGGGTFTGNAELDLFVRANVAAGDYQAKITFLLM